MSNINTTQSSDIKQVIHELSVLKQQISELSQAGFELITATVSF